MSTIASQITSLTIVYSTVYSPADHRKHQSSASLAFVWGIQRWQVNSPHKGPVTRKMLPFDDVIMNNNHSENQFNYPLMSNMSASSFNDGVKSLCGMGQQLTKQGQIRTVVSIWWLVSCGLPRTQILNIFENLWRVISRHLHGMNLALLLNFTQQCTKNGKNYEVSIRHLVVSDLRRLRDIVKDCRWTNNHQ